MQIFVQLCAIYLHSEEMPKNKSYSTRVKMLNTLFRTRIYSMDELIERISEKVGTSVSKKTIQDTIKYMREEGAPIVNLKDKGYRYEPKSYNHIGVILSGAYVEKIKMAVSLLKQIPGLDLHEELNTIFEELNMKAEMETEDELIQFDQRPDYYGSKYMVDVLEAIKGKSVISFDYQPFNYDTPKNIIVHPYLLKEFNNRWYLIGLLEEFRIQERYEMHQFALDRIKNKVRVKANIEYFHVPSFNPAKLYEHIYGMSTTFGNVVEEVLLRFTPLRAKYVATNPLHHTQTCLSDSESTFSFHLIPNKELESLVLSFGADVEVLEPESLRSRIRMIIEDAGRKYS